MKRGISPPELPTDLADLIRAPGSPGDAPAWNGEKIPKGARDSILFAMLCRWRDQGADWDMLVNAGVGFDQRFCDPPLGYNQVLIKVSSCLTRPARQSTVDNLAELTKAWPPFVTADTWQAHLLSQPARVPLLGPLKTSMVGIVYAPPGVGKSNWCLGALDASTRGHAFGSWPGSGQPCRGAYWDGEMYIRDLADRLEIYPGWRIDFQLSQDWPSGGLDLCDSEHQTILFKLCQPHRVVVLDTFLALTRSPDRSNPYSDDRWTRLAPITAWARANQKLLIWVDHTNRAGQLSGSAAKDRDVDFTIRLTRSGDLSTDLAFRLEFKKYRDRWTDATLPSDWVLSDDGWQGEQFQNWAAKVKKWKRDNNHIARKRGAQATCARDLNTSPQEISKHW